MYFLSMWLYLCYEDVEHLLTAFTKKTKPRYLEISHLWSCYLENRAISNFLFGPLRVQDSGTLLYINCVNQKLFQYFQVFCLFFLRYTVLWVAHWTDYTPRKILVSNLTAFGKFGFTSTKHALSKNLVCVRHCLGWKFNANGSKYLHFVELINANNGLRHFFLFKKWENVAFL